MRENYLGDSYDLVKRFWRESLKPIAPLYAHSKFVPARIRAQYTAVTSIPILEARPRGRFGILLDPHTGIPLPDESFGGATASHASLPFVVQVNEELQPSYMICFDQSYHRQHGLTREEQRDVKRKFLRARGIESFYYVSHAPFLFLASKRKVLARLRDRLESLGIPPCRFEPRDA
jgi:hypothetical protein